MTTAGKPIEADVWRWYYNIAGKREAVQRCAASAGGLIAYNSLLTRRSG